MGYSQIMSLDKKLTDRKKIYLYYKNIFENNEIMKLHTNAELYSNFWLNTLSMNFNELEITKIELIKILNKRKIFLRDVWQPHNLNNLNKDCYFENLDNTLKFYKSSINLPSSFKIEL